MPDSNALVGFRQSIGMARQLLQLESQYADPPCPSDNLVVTGLRGGAAVVMVAAFENFLREVFLERLADLATMPPRKSLSQLPERMQTDSIFWSLNAAMRGPLHGAAAGKAARIPEIRRCAKLIVDDVVDVV